MSQIKTTVNPELTTVPASNSHFMKTFIYQRYALALRGAKEILHPSSTANHGIEHELNCGKLTKLIRYLQNGTAFGLILIAASYGEVFCH